MHTSARTNHQAFRIFIFCLAVACAALGYYAVALRADLAALRAKCDAARAERDGARKAEKIARGELAPLQENVARLAAERDRLRNEPPEAGAPAGSVAAPAPADPPFAAFAQTFATPEVRQMMRREALSEARKGFADLLKQWSLPSAEADQFLEFVADRDSADANDALAMLATGTLDENAIAEQEARQEKARTENNARLKALLGDARYAEFEAADARAAELKAISSYRDHLDSAGAPLTDAQRSALAKIVTKEQPDENDWAPEDVEFFTQGMTDAQLRKLRQRQEAAQARIAEQATAFLSPDQIAALQAAFRSEIEEQELALKMARTFMQGAGTQRAEAAK